jgi:hypothetical protein
VGGKIIAVDSEMRKKHHVFICTQFSEGAQRNMQVVSHAVTINNGVHRTLLD